MLGCFVVGAASSVGGCKRSSPGGGDAHDGATLFASACARCHGSEGLGGVPQPGGVVSRNLADPAFQRAMTDDQLEAIIRNGKPPAMPAFGHVFGDEQIAALVDHVRSLAN